MAFSLVLRLEWLKAGAAARKAFRLPGSGELYEEYAARIARYCPLETLGGDAGAYPQANTGKSAGGRVGGRVGRGTRGRGEGRGRGGSKGGLVGGLRGHGGANVGGSAVWCCDPRGKAVSSENLAERLREVRDGGIQRMEIVIGGPDGLSPAASKAGFRWSLGPMILPHELAAVVAVEQLYRAWTILRGEPYHLGH